MDKGFFGGLFDFNGDGKLDSFEKAADFATFMSLLDEENKKTDDRLDELDCDDYADDDED